MDLKGIKMGATCIAHQKNPSEEPRYDLVVEFVRLEIVEQGTCVSCFI